jgi:hypothetical protein
MSSLPTTNDPAILRRQLPKIPPPPSITAPTPAPITPTNIPMSSTTSSGRMIKDKTTQPPRMGTMMPPGMMLPPPSHGRPGPFGGGFPPNRMPGGGPGDFNRRFPERPFLLNPTHFMRFDHRFDDDRVRFNVFDFRREFDDDEIRIFIPVILNSRGIDIALVEFILGLVYDSTIAKEGVPQPTSPGIWEIAVNGLWYRVTVGDEQLIQTIESRRGENHQPIII